VFLAHCGVAAKRLKPSDAQKALNASACGRFTEFFGILTTDCPSGALYERIPRITAGGSEFSSVVNVAQLEARNKMNSELCIGIATRNGAYEVAALDHGRASAVVKFPATRIGIEAIRTFLAGYGNHLRLAVAGVTALSLALALGDVAGRETFIVSSSIADQAVALAHYAKHAI
jgi:hypothetical protein